MLKRPVQLLRIFTFILVLFVGFQVFSLVQFKDAEQSFGNAVSLVSQQQYLVPKIYRILLKYRDDSNDDNLIELNALVSLFKSNQKALLNSTQPIDSLLSGETNDLLIEFLNTLERLKLTEVELTDEFTLIAIEKLPLRYSTFLLAINHHQNLVQKNFKNKSSILVVSLLALILQCMILFFFERDIEL